MDKQIRNRNKLQYNICCICDKKIMSDNPRFPWDFHKKCLFIRDDDNKLIYHGKIKKKINFILRKGRGLIKI